MSKNAMWSLILDHWWKQTTFSTDAKTKKKGLCLRKKHNYFEQHYHYIDFFSSGMHIKTDRISLDNQCNEMTTRNVAGNTELNTWLIRFTIPNFKKFEEFWVLDYCGPKGTKVLKFTNLLYTIELSMIDLLLIINFKKVEELLIFRLVWALRGTLI